MAVTSSQSKFCDNSLIVPYFDKLEHGGTHSSPFFWMKKKELSLATSNVCTQALLKAISEAVAAPSPLLRSKRLCHCQTAFELFNVRATA